MHRPLRERSLHSALCRTITLAAKVEVTLWTSILTSNILLLSGGARTSSLAPSEVTCWAWFAHLYLVACFASNVVHSSRVGVARLSVQLWVLAAFNTASFFLTTCIVVLPTTLILILVILVVRQVAGGFYRASHV